jgi:uncharacterized repeat protein (TIGR01451 family)
MLTALTGSRRKRPVALRLLCARVFALVVMVVALLSTQTTLAAVTSVPPAADPVLDVEDDGDDIRVVVNGTDLEVWLDGGGTPWMTYTLSTLNTLTINGLGGDDTLTVDFGGGDPVPTGGLFFNGGAGGNDTMALQGGSPTDMAYTYSNLNDGSVNVDGSLITYTGLEPIASTITAANVTLTYSDTAETITVSGAGAQTQVSSTLGETTTFNNPTNSLTINAGDVGDDIITVNGFGTGYAATTTTFNGQGGNDTFNINTTQTMNLNGGADDDGFVFADGVNVGTGTVDGQAHTTGDTLDYSAYSTAIAVNLQTGAATGTGGFSNIEALVGGSASDTLTGENNANAWTIDNANQGDVDGFDFSSIENLTGGTGNDTFSIASGATLSGRVDGLGGNDTLTQADGTNAWVVDLANGGDVSDIGDFRNVENLTGGTGADILTFNGGSLSGNIAGGSGDDQLVVNYASGNPGDISFDGNAGSDSITLNDGGAFSTITHNYTTSSSGTIVLDDGALSTIYYSGLTPITDNVVVADRVFNLPGTLDQAVLEDNGVAGDGISRLRSANGTFESTDFADPTNSFTLNAGDGDDEITIEGLESIAAPIAANGQAGTDTFDVSPVISASVTINATGPIAGDPVTVRAGDAVGGVAAAFPPGEDILYVIDLSGSTGAPFGGTPVGDVNGDGSPNTILDAELAGFIALNDELIAKGLGGLVQVGIVSFTSSALQWDVDPVAPGTQIATTPAADANGNSIPDVEEVLRSMNYGGGTNFQPPLQLAINFFTTLGTAPGQGTIIFLSDGSASYNFAPEIVTLDAMGIDRVAVAVGAGASLTVLQYIDADAFPVNSTDELLDGLTGFGGEAIVNYTPMTASQGEVDATGFQPVLVNTTGPLTLDGEDAHLRLTVHTPAATDSTVTVTPGADVDDGLVAVDALLPISFDALGASGYVQIVDPSAADDDTVVCMGTPGADGFVMPHDSVDAPSVGLNAQVGVGLTDVENLTLEALADDDTLTVNFAGGDPTPSGDLTFNGRGGSDAITLNDGGSFDTITHNYLGSDAEGYFGNIQLDSSTIVYSGLSPITDLVVVPNRIFNLRNDVADWAILQDDATPGDGVSELVDGGWGTFEDTVFANPTNSLTMNALGFGDDLYLDDLDSRFNASIDINGGGGDDDHYVQGFDASYGDDIVVDGGGGQDRVWIDDTPSTCGWGGVLYGSDASFPTQLYTVDTTTGVGTPVGALPTYYTEIEYDDTSGRAFASEIDWWTGGGGHEFDINTGAQIGPFIPNAGLNCPSLEYAGPVAYCAASPAGGGPATLYSGDPFAGAWALVGPTTTGPLSGMAYNHCTGVMYAVSGNCGASGLSNLYTIDLSTGVATPVGNTGVCLGSLQFGPDGSLYAGGAWTTAGNLYRINPVTAAPTLVGFTGFAGSVRGLTLVGGGGSGTLTVNGGTATDRVYVSNTAGNLDGFNSMTINGDAGVDYLDVYDQNDVSDNTYTVMDDSVTRNTTVISYTSISYLDLYAGGGDDDLIADGASAATDRIRLYAGGGDDELTVDFDGPEPSPIPGTDYLLFDGQGQGAGGDSIVLNNGSHTNVTYRFDNDNDGAVFFDGDELRYFDLEPVTDNGSAVNRILNFTGGAETIAISGVGAQTQVDSTLGEVVTFNNPSTSLTINAGSGADTVDANGFGTGGGAFSVTINGDDAGDTINVNTRRTTDPFVVNGNAGDDTINIDGKPGTAAFTVNGGADDDTIELGAVPQSLDGLGTLTVNGDAGSDALHLDDTGDADGDSYSVTDLQVARTGGLLVGYATIEELHLDTAGDGDDTVSATGSATTEYFLDGDAHSSGDILNVYPGILSVTSGPASPIQVVGWQDINHQRFEAVNIFGTLADMAIEKAGPTSVWAGEAITYTITVTNTESAIAVALVDIKDDLPNEVSFFDATVTRSGLGPDGLCGGPICQVNNVGPGEVLTVNVVGIVGPDVVSGTVLTNEAAVFTDGDPTPSDSDTHDTMVSQSPSADLTIVKAATPTAVAGETIDYSLTVYNLGPSDVPAVAVNDTLPVSTTFVSASAGCSETAPGSGVVICNLGGLAAGGSTSLTITVTTDVDIEPGTSLENIAAVGSAVFDPNSSNNTATADTSIIGEADLVLEKTGPASATAGNQVTYTIVVTNTGPSVAQTVDVKDDLPDGVTLDSATVTRSGGDPALCGGTVCEVGDMALNEVVTIVVVGTVDASVADSTWITNTATVFAVSPDADASNDSDSQATQVSVEADVSISKVALTEEVAPGGTALFRVTVTNSGPSDALGVTITDPIAPGFVAPQVIDPASANVPAGGSADFFVSVVVNENQAVGNTLVNTATVNFANDSTLGNNTDTASITVIDALPDADVQLNSVALVGGGPVVPGQTVTFTINATNNGPADALGAVLVTAFEDTAYIVDSSEDEGTWYPVGSGGTWIRRTPWLSGTQQTFTVTLMIPADAHYTAADALGPFRAMVAAANPDTVANNSAQLDPDLNHYDVQAQATLTLAKTLFNDGVATGGTALYEIVVCNSGPSDIDGVGVSDTLSANQYDLTLSSDASDLYIADGQCVDVMATAKITDTAAPGDAFSNTAAVTTTGVVQGAGATLAPQVNTPSDTASGNVGNYLPDADMSITKDVVTDPWVAGTENIIRITVTNNGPAEAVDVVVLDPMYEDTLLVGFQQFAANGTTPIYSWGCDAGVTCVRANPMPANTTEILELRVELRPDAPDLLPTFPNITNYAFVAADNPDPDTLPMGSNPNVATDAFTVTTRVTLSVEKFALDDEIVAGGDSMLFTVSVYNDGPSDAYDVVVNDTVDAGLTLLGLIPGDLPMTCGATSCTLDHIPAGDSAEFYALVEAPSSTSAGLYDNTATVTDADNDTFNLPSDDASVDVTVAADMSILKFGPLTVAAADTFVYTVEVHNNGPSDAANVVVTDTLPYGVSYVGPRLFSAMIDGSDTIVELDPASGAVINTIPAPVAGVQWASALAFDGTSLWFIDPDVNTTLYELDPDTGAVIDADPLGLVWPAGLATLGGSVYILDSNLAGEVYEFDPSSDLIVAGPVNLVAMNPALIGFAFDGMAGITAPDALLVQGIDAGSGNINIFEINPNTWLVTNSFAVPSWDLGLATVNGEIYFGGNITQWVDVYDRTGVWQRNFPAVNMAGLGGDDVHAAPCVDGPAGTVVCSLGDMPASDVQTFDIPVQADPDVCYEGKVNNYVEVMAETYEPDLDTNYADWGTVILNNTALTITKWAPSPVNAGETITFELTIENLGPGCATDATVVDTLGSQDNVEGLEMVTFDQSSNDPTPPDFFWGHYSCSQGGVCERDQPMLTGVQDIITLVMRVPADAQPGDYVNDVDVGWDSGGATAAAGYTVEALADLGIEKSVLKEDICLGAYGVYELVVTNYGPSDAQNIVVTDVLSDALIYGGGSPGCAHDGSAVGGVVTCTLGTLPAGASYDFSVGFNIEPDVISGTVVANTASVTSDTAEPDPDPHGNTSAAVNFTAVQCFLPEVDMSIEKDVLTEPWVAGLENLIVITVTNNGLHYAENVVVLDPMYEDTLLVGFEQFAADGTMRIFNWGCDAGVTCVRANPMPPNTTEILVLRAELRPDAEDLMPGFPNVTNYAFVGADNPDPDTPDNMAMDDFVISTRADVSIEKTVIKDDICLGDYGFYLLAVTNDGPSDAKNVVVTDVLSDALIYGGGSPGCVHDGSAVGGVVTCTIGTLPASGRQDLFVGFNIEPDVISGTLIANTAVVTTTTTDPDPGASSNSDSADFTAVQCFLPEADMSITKDVVTEPWVAGTENIIRITVTNNGLHYAENVVVLDPMYEDTLLVGFQQFEDDGSTPIFSWGCDAGVSCVRANPMPPNTTEILELRVELRPDMVELLGGTDATNYAFVGADNPDPNVSPFGPNANVATDDFVVASDVNLSIIKDELGVDIMAGGDPVLYTIVVYNSGPSDAYNVVITDTPTSPHFSLLGDLEPGDLPMACLGDTCVIPVLEADQSMKIYATLAAASDTPPGVQEANTACIAAVDPMIGEVNNQPNPDALPICDSEDTNVTVAADMSIIKTGPLTVTAADVFTYTVEVHNNGPSDAENVVVVDTLPYGVNYAGTGGVLYGSDWVNLYAIDVTTGIGTPVGSLPGGGATVIEIEYDNTTGRAFNQLPGPSIGGGYEFDINTGAPIGPFIPNGGVNCRSLEYAGPIAYCAASPEASQGPSLLYVGDPFLGAWAPVGHTGTGPISGLAYDDLSGTMYAVTGACPGWGTSNLYTIDLSTGLTNSWIGDTNVCLGSIQFGPDGSLYGVDTMWSIGATLYRINTATASATMVGAPGSAGAMTGLMLVDPGPPCVESSAGTLICDLSNMPASDVQTFDIPVRADPDVCYEGKVNNYVEVMAETYDPDLDTNYADWGTVILSEADLEVSKSGTPATVNAGERITYTIGVTNTGPGCATDVELLDLVPYGTNVVAMTASSSVNEVEPNDSIPAAQDLDGQGWSLQFDPDIGDTASNTSTSIPHVTIYGTGDDTYDYYVFTVHNAGDRGIFDIDYGTTGGFVDAFLDLFRADGTWLAADDDSPTAWGAGGSTSSLDSYLEYVFPAPGTYVIRVGRCCVGPVPAGSGYRLQVSIENKPLGGGSFCSLNGTCDLGTLPAGGMQNVSLVLEVDPSYAGSTVVNEVHVSSDATDPDLFNNTASETTTITTTANLTITKSGSITATAGSTIEYIINVGNTGPSDAQSVIVTDTFPAALENVSATVDDLPGACGFVGNAMTCNLGTLPVGEAATIRVSADVLSSITGTVVNTAYVDGATNGAKPNDSHTTAIVTSADLSLDKTATPTAIAGETIDYILTVYNDGPSDSGALAVNDTLPISTTYSSASAGCDETAPGSGVVVCDAAGLAAGSSTTFTITVTVDDGVQSGTSLENTASVGSVTPDPNSSNNTANADTSIVPVADLVLSKTGPASIIAGNQISYTITVTNTGPSVGLGVDVKDDLPDGVTLDSATVTRTGGDPALCGSTVCEVGDMAVDEVVTVVVVGTVDPSVADSTWLTNTATVFSVSRDPDLTDNSDTQATQVSTEADLAVVKSDLQDPVHPTSGFIYEIVVTNNGPSDAQGVVVTDTLGAGLTFAGASPGCARTAVSTVITCTVQTLPAGGSVDFLITAIAGDLPDGTVLTNTVDVDTDTTDLVSGNNQYIENTTIQHNPGASADLGITKSATPTTVNAGETITYTLTITNNGPTTAYNTLVLENLPNGTTFVSATPYNPDFDYEFCTLSGVCYLGTIHPWPSTVATITVVLRVEPDYALSGVTNLAAVSSDQIDHFPDNNITSSYVTVTTWANLSLDKVDMTDPVIAGEVLLYELRVTNSGPSDAQGVLITDTIPISTTFVGPSEFCIEDTGTVTCTVGTVPAGEDRSVFLQVRTSELIIDGTIITNTAYLSALNGSSDMDTEATRVVQSPLNPADLGIAKYFDPSPTVVAGTRLTYTLVISNAGPAPATSIQVVDYLPFGLDLVSVTPSQGLCRIDLTCDLGDLPDPATAGYVPTATVTLVTEVRSDQLADLTNVARVSASNPDYWPDNNEATTVTPVDTEAFLVISKSDDPSIVTPGSDLTYEIVVRNDGPSDARDVTVTDTLPIEVTGAIFSSSQGSCAGNVCSLGTIPDGEDAIIDVIASVVPSATVPFTNTAEVGSSTTNTNAANRVVEEVTLVWAIADLALHKQATPTVYAGELITYTLTVNHYGLSDAQNVVLTDTLPISTTFVSASAGCAETPPASGVVRCAHPTLAPLDTISYTIVVRTDDDIVPGTSLENVAFVTSDTADSDPSNNSADADTSIIEGAGLMISKTGPETAAPGMQITYTIVVTNTGPSVAHGIEVKEFLPDMLTLDGISGERSGDGFIVCHGVVCQVSDDMAVGEVVTMVVTTTLDLDFHGDVFTNTAVIFPSGEFDTHAMRILKVYLPIVLNAHTAPILPDLVGSFSLTPDKSSYAPGESVLITAQVTNQGNAPAGPFWVDFYINPDQVPEVNTLWSDACSLVPCYGIAWGVPGGLAPGDTILLTSTPGPGDSPPHYHSSYTIWPGSFAPGTTDLYLFVDSWNPGDPGNSTGLVSELNEANNLSERHGLSVTGAGAAAADSGGASPYDLPPRGAVE